MPINCHRPIKPNHVLYWPFWRAHRACEYLLVQTQFHSIVKSRLHPIFRPWYYCMLDLSNQLWGYIYIYIYMLLYIKSHHLHSRYWEKTCSLEINNPRLFQLVKQISTCINLGGSHISMGKFEKQITLDIVLYSFDVLSPFKRMD